MQKNEMAAMMGRLAMPTLTEKVGTPLQKFLGDFSTAVENGTKSLQSFDQRVHAGIEKVVAVSKACKALSDATRSLIKDPLSTDKSAAHAATKKSAATKKKAATKKAAATKKTTTKNAHAASKTKQTGTGSGVDKTNRAAAGGDKSTPQRLDINVQLSLLTVQVTEFGNALQKAGATAKQMLSGTSNVTANLIVVFKNLGATSALMTAHIHQALTRASGQSLAPLANLRSSERIDASIDLMLQRRAASQAAASTSNTGSRLKLPNSQLHQSTRSDQNTNWYQLMSAASYRKSLPSNKGIKQFEFLAEFASATPPQALRHQGPSGLTPGGRKKTQAKFDSSKASKKLKSPPHLKNPAQEWSGELNIKNLKGLTAHMKAIKSAQGALDIFATASDKAHGWRGALKFSRSNPATPTATKKRPHEPSKPKSRSLQHSAAAPISSHGILAPLLAGPLTAFDLKFQKMGMALDLQVNHGKSQRSRAKDKSDHTAGKNRVRHKKTAAAAGVGLNTKNRLSRPALNGMLNAAKRIGPAGVAPTTPAAGGHTIHFSPVINIGGDTAGANVHSQVQVAMQTAYADFELNMTRFLRAKNRTAFN